MKKEGVRKLQPDTFIHREVIYHFSSFIRMFDTVHVEINMIPLHFIIFNIIMKGCLNTGVLKEVPVAYCTDTVSYCRLFIGTDNLYVYILPVEEILSMIFSILFLLLSFLDWIVFSTNCVIWFSIWATAWPSSRIWFKTLKTKLHCSNMKSKFQTIRQQQK